MLRDAMPINNGIKDNRQCLLLLSLLLLFFTSQMHSMLLILKIEFASQAHTRYSGAVFCLRFGHRMFALLLSIHSFIRSHSDGFISNAHTLAVWNSEAHRNSRLINTTYMHACYACDTITSVFFSFDSILMDT